MKIISKFKDYYDYFQGIYGTDPLLILDRTEFYRTPSSYLPETLRYKSNDDKFELVRFWVCDYLVEGCFNNGRFLYGKDLEKFSVNSSWGERNFPDYYHIPDKYSNNRTFKVLKSPVLFIDRPIEEVYFKEWKVERCPNTIMNCPILIQPTLYNSAHFEKFPILADYDFHKVFTAFQLWTMLTEWLGREKNITDNRTNKERILSNGFDLQTSFRHPVK